MKWIVLTTLAGDLEVIAESIVTMRDALKTENGTTAISLTDGRTHLVIETRKEIHKLLED
jgi:hypothetical protein